MNRKYRLIDWFVVYINVPAHPHPLFESNSTRQEQIQKSFNHKGQGCNQSLYLIRSNKREIVNSKMVQNDHIY